MSQSDHESAAAFPGHPINTESFDGQGHLRKTKKREEIQGHTRVLEFPGAEVHVHSFSLKQSVATDQHFR